MPRIELRFVGGGLLVALGVLLLLQTLGVFAGGVNLLLAVVLGAGGVLFLGVFFSAPRLKWWAALPGIILLDLAALMVFGLISPSLACTPRLGGWVLSCSDLAGALFLGGIGLSFWAVYVANRAQWWAVIPGGALFTLAVVMLAGANLHGAVGGGVFLLGMGGTFLLVGLLPSPQEKMTWAFIPAVVLIALGVVLIAALTALSGYVWALALIALGGWLMLRALRRG
jgi:hypothetical protein